MSLSPHFSSLFSPFLRCAEEEENDTTHPQQEGKDSPRAPLETGFFPLSLCVCLLFFTAVTSSFFLATGGGTAGDSRHKLADWESVPKWWEGVQGVNVDEVETFIRIKHSWGNELSGKGVPDIYAALERLEDAQLVRIADDNTVHSVSMLQLLDFAPQKPEEWREYQVQRRLEEDRRRRRLKELDQEVADMSSQEPTFSSKTAERAATAIVGGLSALLALWAGKKWGLRSAGKGG